MNGLEETLQNFNKKIEIVDRQSIGVPRKFEIDLSVAIIDQPYDIAGNFFYVWSAPDESSYVSIRVNGTNEPAIDYSVHTGLITPFRRLYITTPAGQAGTMVIIYATEAPEFLRVLDNRSTTVAGVGGVLDELRGDLTPETNGVEVTVGAAAVLAIAANANRKACWLHADINNTGTIYLGFTNAVTTAAGGAIWFACLSAGQGWGVDDYRGDIYAIATAAGQLLGTGEW